MASSHTDLADRFAALADLDAEAQAEALAEINDAALRAELAALLDADAEADTRLGRLDRLPSVGLALAPAAHEPSAVGERIGRYVLTEEIGRGGMGVVYRARDERLGRDVAVKVLPRALAADPEARARLEAEARAASALEHANVCTVHALEETDGGGLALVMAHYAGETLKDRLRRGPLPPAEAADVARQIAAGLAAAHAAGVVHRDVKPSNVLLGADGVVRVLDFGIARSAGSDLTRTGATLGTAAYMAPEQTRGARADARADVWALGVVLHEMLTGDRPFAGRGDALVHAIRHDAPPALPDGTPGPLRSVVARALAKDPADRFPDSGALRGALDAPSPPASGTRWRRPAIWAATALILAAALWWALRPEAVPDDAFVIAVAPFAAVGQGAQADADVMPALIRRELDAVLADEPGVRVVEAGGEAPRSEAEAVALGESEGAHLVVWGEAVALRGEVEIRPALARAAPYEAIGDVAGTSPSALLADLSGGDQIALRRTKAAEVGDLALHVAAQYALGRGRVERARALLGRVRQPTAETFAQRGWVELFEEDYPAAAGHFRRALDRDSASVVNWLGHGVALIEQGRATDAERAFRRGLEATPDDPRLLAMLAWSLSFQGRMDEAVPTAQAAARSDPDSHLGALSLGWARYMSGDAEAAIEAFGELVERADGGRPAAMGHYGIAVAERGRGDLDAAGAAIRQALRLSPTGADYLVFQGDLAMARDDLSQAERAYARLDSLGRSIDYALTLPLFLSYLRARQGRDDVAPLRAIADTAAADGYLVPLYRFALGEATEAEVLAAADRVVPRLGRGWRYEAALHLGQFYEAGVGAVAPDRQRAVAFYREAARRYQASEYTSYADDALRRLGTE